MTTPTLRLTALNQAPVNPAGDYVLYWMIAQRRLHWNFALDRAIDRAEELGKPLLIFEPLRAGYPWASDRLHAFVLAGMAEHREVLSGGPVGYFPYVEPQPGAGRGLLEALSRRAALVVTDDYPCFFLPRMVAAAATALRVRLEAVDGNGLLPMRASEQVFSRAVDFRRFLQRRLPEHLFAVPRATPLATTTLPQFLGVPTTVLERWPEVDAESLARPTSLLATLPIDHRVGPVALPGGERAARGRLHDFVSRRLERYQERNQPEVEAASGLSPYLHFGHLSPHEVFYEVSRHEQWSPLRLATAATGSREGWWGMSPAAEGFLDQLLTWRELGFNMSSKQPDYELYESLPEWARRSLDEHAADPREALYEPAEFESAATHDEVWNAAQRELASTGVLHNYLRMVWGKMILLWSRSPREALATMIHLNNKYALDGRDPNSYSGIFWCLGRYDRPWAPRRAVFGVVRCMTTASTRRKLQLGAYLRRFGPQAGLDL